MPNIFPRFILRETPNIPPVFALWIRRGVKFSERGEKSKKKLKIDKKSLDIDDDDDDV
jgi:hypothetical protein